jgi:hypothetical protein
MRVTGSGVKRIAVASLVVIIAILASFATLRSGDRSVTSSQTVGLPAESLDQRTARERNDGAISVRPEALPGATPGATPEIDPEPLQSGEVVELNRQAATETPDDETLPARLDEIQLPPEVISGLRTVEREFDAESKDPGWSAAMESRIFSEISVAASGVDVTDVRVDCRTTLCRVQLTRPTPVERGRTPPAAPGSTPAGQPSPIFRVAEALGLDFRIVVGAFDGYGTPITLGFLQRGESEDSSERSSD